MIEGILQWFEELKDTRPAWKILYKLPNFIHVVNYSKGRILARSARNLSLPFPQSVVLRVQIFSR